MKFPFDFSIKLVFRLIFPGMILAAALIPAFEALSSAIGAVYANLLYAYPFEAVALGWLVVVCDMHIYMLFEGRRYWPYPIRWGFTKLQQRRLDRLHGIIYRKTASRRMRLQTWVNTLLKTKLNLTPDPRRVSEASVVYLQYPIDEYGDSYVEFPTRLGNIIESYEKYPEIKYGLDSIFYWPRLWVIIDKDLREEIDNAQSLVDSTVYISFSFYLSGLIMFAYAGIAAARRVYWWSSWLPFLDEVRLPFVPASPVLVCMGLACLIAGFVIYRLSLAAHATFGELFKSVFDMHRSKLDFEDVVAMVSGMVNDRGILRKSAKEKDRIAALYLQWHRIHVGDIDYTPKELTKLAGKAAVSPGNGPASPPTPTP